MSVIGKLEVAVELKSNADKFWTAIQESDKLFPKVLPDVFKSIEILEGDGKAVGSVRLIRFVEGFPVSMSKEKVEAVDEEKKTLAYSIIDGDLLGFYKSFKAELAVVPKEEGSLVDWSCEFEKAHEDIPDPDPFKDFALKTFQDLDAFLLKA